MTRAKKRDHSAAGNTVPRRPAAAARAIKVGNPSRGGQTRPGPGGAQGQHAGAARRGSTAADSQDAVLVLYNIMRLQLDPQSPVPLYHQLAESLRYRIATGALRPGQPLPPLREAARRWG